ncbi:hypothetical protein R1sor_009227 [Riccia sorocarpa]|uniref:J domain-containing protein n=1 Tax=Riccia sorocarpa TaxID=122646 RepID=A0ABD3H5D8_9MARC
MGQQGKGSPKIEADGITGPMPPQSSINYFEEILEVGSEVKRGGGNAGEETDSFGAHGSYLGSQTPSSARANQENPHAGDDTGNYKRNVHFTSLKAEYLEGSLIEKERMWRNGLSVRGGTKAEALSPEVGNREAEKGGRRVGTGGGKGTENSITDFKDWAQRFCFGRGCSGAEDRSESSATSEVKNSQTPVEEANTTQENAQDCTRQQKLGISREDGVGFRIGTGRFFPNITLLDPEPLAEAARVVRLQIKEKLQIFCHIWLPILKRWLILTSRGILVFSLLSLECGIRGFSSIFRLSSAAVFLLTWCTALNLSLLAGLFNFCLVLVTALGAGFFLGYVPAFALTGLLCSVVLWLYGSFWTSAAVMLVGGGFLIFDHARVAILVSMLYSVYSVKRQGGWGSLALCIVLAFISSDILVYFLSKSSEGKRGVDCDGKIPFGVHEQENSKSGSSNQYQSGENSRPSAGISTHRPDASPNSGVADGARYAEALPNGDDQRSSGRASTSGSPESDAKSAEEEVARVLSCRDHYAVIGFSRYEPFDVATLKREYRKKAMLVHPDKNRGNEEAEEAFKRLQNAYEVLYDSVKRKSYDDDLRKEEVLYGFRQHRQGFHQGCRCGSPNCGCNLSDDEADDHIPAGSRSITCRKCNHTHFWLYTDRSKLRARWCKDCNDYHQARDGDGWVEQSWRSFFFGIFRKVDLPHAYACADGRVYDVTEWVVCQGMKCPPNTHKPTFYVSTAGAGKGTTRNSCRAPRSAGRNNVADGFSFADLDENMTEHEFFDWLEQAMASGMFSDLNVPGYPGARGPSRGGKPSRKKRKGKKHW